MITLINRRSFGPGIKPIDTLIGLSTDSKPETCGNGSRFYNMDLGKWSYYNEDAGLWITEATVYLDSITITTPPDTTSYNEGEPFDDTGMVVTATYTDGSEESGVTFDYLPAGPLTADDTVIDVIFADNGVVRHATQAITVA